MLEPILNRWRGTGKIFWKISGNIIYAIYWCILIFSLSFLYYNSYISILIGLLFAGLYILGESFCWGKWVGYLTYSDSPEDYDNPDGKSFPWVHYIAETFIEQRDDYKNYCRLALAIRGLFWWVLPVTFLYSIQLIPLWFVPVTLMGLSIGFPIAAELGKRLDFEYHSRYLNLSRGWENQELIYGFIHFLFLTAPLLCFNVF